MYFKSCDKIESDLEWDIDNSNPIICANQSIMLALIFMYNTNTDYLFLVYMNIYFIANTKLMRKMQFHFYAIVFEYKKNAFSFLCCSKSPTHRNWLN